MSFGMLIGTIHSPLFSFGSDREKVPLVEGNCFPLKLTFQPFVYDKG